MAFSVAVAVKSIMAGGEKITSRSTSSVLSARTFALHLRSPHVTSCLSICENCTLGCSGCPVQPDLQQLWVLFLRKSVASWCRCDRIKKCKCLVYIRFFAAFTCQCVRFSNCLTTAYQGYTVHYNTAM